MKMQMTRDFYVPKDYTRRARNEALGVEVFVDPTGLLLMGFSGKRQKPDFHTRFRSEDRAAEHVRIWMEGLQSHQVRVKERRAEASKPHTLQVGDLLRSSWGYDQTNIDYYQVTKLIGTRMVEIRPIAQSAREDGWLQGQCTPVPDHFTGKPTRHVVGEGNAVKVRSFAWAYPCSAEDVSRWSAYA